MGGIGGYVVDWLTANVAPEWILVGSAVTSLLCMVALFLVLVRITRPVEPAARGPVVPASRLRTAPYVRAHEARHAAPVEHVGRDPVDWRHTRLR